MIPTIDDIFTMLRDGKCSYEQARGWVDAHIEMTEEQAHLSDVRDSFAAAALTAMTRMVNDQNITAQEVAAGAYHIADAMMNERAR